MRILVFETGLEGEDAKTLLKLKTADKLQILVRNFKILGNSDMKDDLKVMRMYGITQSYHMLDSSLYKHHEQIEAELDWLFKKH